MSLRLDKPRVLADSSVWIDHVRRGNSALAELLDTNQVVMHDFVLGELALGTIPRGHPIALDLTRLDRAEHASHADVMELVRTRKLEGAGIGWVDAHLLASALVSAVTLWTLDARLRLVARSAGVAHA